MAQSNDQTLENGRKARQLLESVSSFYGKQAVPLAEPVVISGRRRRSWQARMVLVLSVLAGGGAAVVSAIGLGWLPAEWIETAMVSCAVCLVTGLAWCLAVAVGVFPMWVNDPPMLFAEPVPAPGCDMVGKPAGPRVPPDDLPIGYSVKTGQIWLGDRLIHSWDPDNRPGEAESDRGLKIAMSSRNAFIKQGAVDALAHWLRFRARELALALPPTSEQRSYHVYAEANVLGVQVWPDDLRIGGELDLRGCLLRRLICMRVAYPPWPAMAVEADLTGKASPRFPSPEAGGPKHDFFNSKRRPPTPPPPPDVTKR